MLEWGAGVMFTSNMADWTENLRFAQRSLETEFDFHPVDLTDCPVFLTVALPRDAHATGLKPRIPSGRGLSPALAMSSAVGEAVELTASLAQNAAPEANDLEMRDGLAHVALGNAITGQRTFIPAQDVYLDWAAVHGERPVVDANSNGCAAGLTQQSAMLQALLEIVERDALATWWYGRQRRPHLPLAILDDVEPRLSWWLSGRDRRTLLVDVSPSAAAYVVAAVSANSAGRHIAIGSAAGSSLRGAAIRAITEMIQTEVAMDSASTHSDQDFTTWIDGASLDMVQFQPAVQSDLHGLPRVHALERVAQAGHSVLVADITRQQNWLHVMRVIVPGYSAMQGRFNASRILDFASLHPEFGGSREVADFEKLEPF